MTMWCDVMLCDVCADRQVILRATADSAQALSYIIVLLFLFFFHFGVAGVFLFAENDPYFFGNIGKAFVTLFQISTLDSWAVIARTNMYGCDLYGYQTGEDYFDDKCENPNGLGWLAAGYFFIFIVFGTMVLLSLFIGIIIASMEIIKLGIKEEDLIWKKVADVQATRKYMTSATISNLLEIFDLIDIGANGVLTMIELKPVLELVSKSESVQYTIFMKVDQDYSGSVDFAEFLELVHHLGVAYTSCASKLLRKHPSKLSRKRSSESGSNFFSFKNLGSFLTGTTETNLTSCGESTPRKCSEMPEMEEDNKNSHSHIDTLSCGHDSDAIEYGSKENTEEAKGYSLAKAVSFLRGNSSRIFHSMNSMDSNSKSKSNSAFPSKEAPDGSSRPAPDKDKDKPLTRRALNKLASFPRDKDFSDSGDDDDEDGIDDGIDDVDDGAAATSPGVAASHSVNHPISSSHSMSGDGDGDGDGDGEDLDITADITKSRYVMLHYNSFASNANSSTTDIVQQFGASSDCEDVSSSRVMAVSTTLPPAGGLSVGDDDDDGDGDDDSNGNGDGIASSVCGHATNSNVSCNHDQGG
jgi:hypothetical protein